MNSSKNNKIYYVAYIYIFSKKKKKNIYTWNFKDLERLISSFILTMKLPMVSKKATRDGLSNREVLDDEGSFTVECGYLALVRVSSYMRVASKNKIWLVRTVSDKKLASLSYYQANFCRLTWLVQASISTSYLMYKGKSICL